MGHDVESEVAVEFRLATEQQQIIENIASLAGRLREARAPLEIRTILADLQSQVVVLSATMPSPVGTCPNDGSLLHDVFGPDGTKYALCPYGHRWPPGP